LSFCKLALSSINKLSRFIKDLLPIASHSNVVYRINYLNCEASYVGQTRRTLKTMIDKHMNHIKRNTLQSSVITNRLKYSHDFDWTKKSNI